MNKIPSPVDVASQRAAELAPMLEAACGLVAMELRVKRSAPISIATRLIDRRVLAQVIAEVESAGWLVTVVPDQRDGDYLSIEAAL